MDQKTCPHLIVKKDQKSNKTEKICKKTSGKCSSLTCPHSRDVDYEYDY